MEVPRPSFCNRSIALGPEIRISRKYLVLVWQNAMMGVTGDRLLLVRSFAVLRLRTASAIRSGRWGAIRLLDRGCRDDGRCRGPSHQAARRRRQDRNYRRRSGSPLQSASAYQGALEG